MFIEKPASKLSITMRKLVCGIGINDAWYITKKIVDGKEVKCPFYKTWKGMLVRCYSPVSLKRHPSYAACTVCEDWLTFSKFRHWMEGENWQGLDLEKDIRIPGNKIYSPETCLFASRLLNGLIESGQKKGKLLPTGVSRSRKKYKASYSVAGENTYIGTYDSIPEAETAYKGARFAYINDVAEDQPEPIKSALINYALVTYS